MKAEHKDFFMEKVVLPKLKADELEMFCGIDKTLYSTAYHTRRELLKEYRRRQNE